MREIFRVITKLDQLYYTILNYDRSEYRTGSRKHISTLTILLRHCSLKSYFRQHMNYLFFYFNWTYKQSSTPNGRIQQQPQPQRVTNGSISSSDPESPSMSETRTVRMILDETMIKLFFLVGRRVSKRYWMTHKVMCPTMLCPISYWP